MMEPAGVLSSKRKRWMTI
jgi:hypothetical protein